MNGSFKLPLLSLCWQSFLEAGARWVSDSCVTMAAAVAFFASFSLAPTLVIVIAVAGFFFGPEAVQGRLLKEIAGLTGDDGAKVIQTMVASAWKADNSSWTTTISTIAIIVGASATFSQLHDAVNTIWRRSDAIAPPATSTLWVGARQLLKVRLMSFGIVIGISFLMLVLLVLDAGMTVAIEWLWGVDSVLYVAQQATVLLMLCTIFAILLRLMPEQPLRWRDVFAGALVAAVLFTAGKHLFGLYLARAGTANAFGAAGSLAVILMWLFYSAAVFLFGAEFAAAWTRLSALRDEPADDVLAVGTRDAPDRRGP